MLIFFLNLQNIHSETSGSLKVKEEDNYIQSSEAQELGKVHSILFNFFLKEII